MTPSTGYSESSARDPVPAFLNDRVLQALKIQVAILEARSRLTPDIELESLFVKVESLLRDLVREAGAA
jgi:hypothetical protein